MEKSADIGVLADYNVRQDTIRLLKQKGPSLDKALLRLRQALNAEETKVIKLKGAVSKDALPKKVDVLVRTGTIIRNEDGIEFGDGESLIKYDVVAHGIRLKAVELALTLHDAMPNQRHDHNIHADPEFINAIISGLPNEFADGVCAELTKLISARKLGKGTPKKS